MEEETKASLLLFVFAIIGFVLVVTTNSDKVELTDVLGWVFMSFLPLFFIVLYLRSMYCARENRNGGNSAGSQGRVQRFQIEVL